MSIIYDALKKVEKTHPQQPQEPLTKKPGKSFSFLKIFIGLFIFALLFLTAKFLFIKTTVKTQTSDKPTLKPENIATPPLPSTPAPEKIKEKEVAKILENVEKDLKGKFVLNGVFFTDNRGFALINNRIAKEGDSIDDAIVQKITLDEVELDYQGTILKLNSASKN